MTAGTRRPRLRLSPVPLCPVCGKRAYSSRRAARLAARILHPSMRMYAYPHLGRWHITSETSRDRAYRRYRRADGRAAA